MGRMFGEDRVPFTFTVDELEHGAYNVLRLHEESGIVQLLQGPVAGLALTVEQALDLAVAFAEIRSDLEAIIQRKYKAITEEAR